MYFLVFIFEKNRLIFSGDNFFGRNLCFSARFALQRLKAVIISKKKWKKKSMFRRGVMEARSKVSFFYLVDMHAMYIQFQFSASWSCWFDCDSILVLTALRCENAHSALLLEVLKSTQKYTGCGTHAVSKIIKQWWEHWPYTTASLDFPLKLPQAIFVMYLCRSVCGPVCNARIPLATSFFTKVNNFDVNIAVTCELQVTVGSHYAGERCK